MSKYCITKSGVISNIIEIEDAMAAQFGAVLLPDGAKIGDKYPEPVPTPTAEEQMRADIDYLAAMQGVTL